MPKTIIQQHSQAPQNRNDTREVRNGLQNGSVTASMRASILPPPDEMERYEQHCPGITKTLIDSYTAQVSHRIELEKIVITSKERRASKGQTFAFILGMVALLGGFSLIAIGKDGYGISAIIGAIATLLTAFFGGVYLQKKDLSDKARKNQ
jgi:uncharacterized membrane protein